MVKGLKQLNVREKEIAMEFEIKQQFENLGITTTLTRASEFNPYYTKIFEIIGDNGTDGLAQINIREEIIKIIIQSIKSTSKKIQKEMEYLY